MRLTFRSARLAIAIGRTQARILAMRPSLIGRPQMVQHQVDLDWERLEDPAQRSELITALRQVKSRCPASSYQVLISLPPEAAWRAELPAPPPSKPGMEAPPEDLSALGPWPLEEMVIARPKSASRSGDSRALVARRRPLEELAALLNEAGLAHASISRETDLLAWVWPRLKQGPREGLVLYLEDARVQWAALEKGRPLASGQLNAREGESAADLARRCLGSVANRLEPWTVSALFLAGPAAEQGVEMATGQSESEEEPAAIPVHKLERSVLLPQGLSWPYLPLFGVLNRGGEAPGGMDLWPGPPEESPLDNPRLTMILAGVLALLLVVAAVQYVLLPYLERNRAEQLVTRLKDERGRLRAQKQELLRTQDALQAVDQVAESREQALSGLLEVAELLPEDTWLQEFEYSQGGIVLTVQGGAKQELKKSLAGSRLLSLTGEPSQAPAPRGQVAWKISLTFQEDGAAPPPAEARAPRPAQRRPAPPPVRRPSPPPTPRPLPPGGGLPRPN